MWTEENIDGFMRGLAEATNHSTSKNSPFKEDIKTQLIDITDTPISIELASYMSHVVESINVVIVNNSTGADTTLGNIFITVGDFKPFIKLTDKLNRYTFNNYDTNTTHMDFEGVGGQVGDILVKRYQAHGFFNV